MSKSKIRSRIARLANEDGMEAAQVILILIVVVIVLIPVIKMISDALRTRGSAVNQSIANIS